MVRKRRGRALHGWLVVDKPVGVTSTQVADKARRALGAQKAGHAGTLDPLATGVLPVAFGEATKTVPHAQRGLKTYRFTVRLGRRTTTDDAEGEALARSDARPTDEEIRAALPAFEGDIEQVPPRYSAVKVAGKRAYDLARQGAEMDLASRPLRVERLALLARPDLDHVDLELVCGKGGYVRSIARDLGEALGCHGHVARLTRTASGGFTREMAVPFERLDGLGADDGVGLLLPLEVGLFDLPEIRVRAPDAARLRHGNDAPMTGAALDHGEEAWASCAGVPVALVTCRGGMLRPNRVFVGLEPDPDGNPAPSAPGESGR